MPAGTITLTNNSATVAGNGTVFTTALAAGDFIVATAGGITYTLPVKSVDSDTALTLVSNYPGPDQAGSAWSAVPRTTQNQITAALVAQTTEALRGLNYDKQNWQQVFSESTNITILLPDGSTFTGPSWLKIVDLLKDTDIDGLRVIADQVRTDANQASLDKTTASEAAAVATSEASVATDQAAHASNSAVAAAQSENNAATSEVNSAQSEITAGQEADRAKNEADRAELAANQAGGVQMINGKSPDADGIVNLDIEDIQGVLPVAQGGTGATNAEDSRANLGLGSASTRDVGTETGNVMQVGAFGVGSEVAASSTADHYNNVHEGGFFFLPSAVAGGPLSSVGCKVTVIPFSSDGHTQIAYPQALSASAYKRIFIRHRISGSWGTWDEHYTTANTTKASDGTLKAASPVARIVKSKEECKRQDIDETGFSWCGCGTANAEAEGINISRRDVGIYVLTGSAGLASEGWRLLPPRDPDGSGDLGIVDAEETESGGITVRLYKRRYVLNEEGDIELVKGALIDVPANSWIDIRLDMPVTAPEPENPPQAE